MKAFEFIYLHKAKLAFGLTVLFSLTLVTTLWYSSPDMLFEVGATMSSLQMSMFGEDVQYTELTFAESDVDYLNRVYEDRTHEVGYCGLIEGNKVTQLTMADTLKADEANIVFSVENCPYNRYVEEEQRLLLHTHPGGSDWLSDTDKKAFLNGTYDVSCIQHGDMAIGKDGISCFEKDGVDSIDEKFSEIDVDLPTVS